MVGSDSHPGDSFYVMVQCEGFCFFVASSCTVVGCHLINNPAHPPLCHSVFRVSALNTYEINLNSSQSVMLLNITASSSFLKTRKENVFTSLDIFSALLSNSIFLTLKGRVFTFD